MFTGAGITTENTVKGAKFVNAKPVYFPKIDALRKATETSYFKGPDAV